MLTLELKSKKRKAVGRIGIRVKDVGFPVIEIGAYPGIRGAWIKVGREDIEKVVRSRGKHKYIEECFPVFLSKSPSDREIRHLLATPRGDALTNNQVLIKWAVSSGYGGDIEVNIPDQNTIGKRKFTRTSSVVGKSVESVFYLNAGQFASAEVSGRGINFDLITVEWDGENLLERKWKDGDVVSLSRVFSSRGESFSNELADELAEDFLN